MRTLRKLFRLIITPFEFLFMGLAMVVLKLVEWFLIGVTKFSGHMADKCTDKVIPFPEDADEDEFSKRLNMNLDIMIKNMYVPDKKLEKMMGCSPIDEEPKIKDDISYGELVECYKKVNRYFHASSAFCKKHANMVSAMCTDYQERVRLTYEGKKAKTRFFDDKATSLKMMKKLWAQCVKEAEYSLEELPDNKEDLKSLVEGQMIASFEMIKGIITSCYQLLIITGLDYHSTKISLYALR